VIGLTAKTELDRTSSHGGSETQPNLLKVANCIHIREKFVQIVLTFLILGITIIWCHSFTRFTDTERKCIVVGSLSKHFTLVCTFLSTLLLIIYPSQPASNNLANEFLNNLFNSSGGGSTEGDPWYNSGGGGSTSDDPWYY
jgi:hypothetical protein